MCRDQHADVALWNICLICSVALAFSDASSSSQNHTVAEGLGSDTRVSGDLSPYSDKRNTSWKDAQILQKHSDYYLLEAPIQRLQLRQDVSKAEICLTNSLSSVKQALMSR